jgi:hypothetical protein
MGAVDKTAAMLVCKLVSADETVHSNEIHITIYASVEPFDVNCALFSLKFNVQNSNAHKKKITTS